ncbi:MAG: Cation efflux system protein CusC precursor [Alphaproteobacteria bacterium ADurb.Bin438]|nr:MAG: Cation efflux system protein CusC precursor [Alphaproteobacteria bacterium ADurb.Bin438]
MKKMLASMTALLLISSCAVGPDYNKVSYDTPLNWESDSFKLGKMRLEKWWEVFGDNDLNDLIKLTKSKNPDIKMASLRLSQADLMINVSESLLYPSLSTSPYLKRDKQSETLKPEAMGKSANVYGLDLTASWELDIWGKTRRNLEASQANFELSKASYDDILVVLYSNVASNYNNLRTLQKRLRVMEKNVKAQQSTLEIVKKKYEAQLVSELDVLRATQNLKSSEAMLPELRGGILKVKNILSMLVGVKASELNYLLKDEGEVLKLKENVEIAIPAEVLRQRPDIRMAEAELKMQTALIGVKKADLLPTLSISGVFGFGANSSGLFRAENQIWSLGGASFLTLFDFNRIKNLVKIEELKAKSSLYNYEKVVLNALVEVENSIVSYVSEDEKQKSLEIASNASARAVEQVKALYENGLTDFQNVLSAERDLLMQQDNLIQSKGLKNNAIISLYKSFGGGWQNQEVEENEK